MPEKNIELFKKMRERIATIPDSYNQSVFVTRSAKAPCGTAACLAGEAIICNAANVSDGIAELKRLDGADYPWAVADRAAALLRLAGNFGAFADEDDAEAAGETLIFDGEADYWPEPYRSQFKRGDEAAAAVALLDDIIENDGRIVVNVPTYQRIRG